MKEIDYDDVVLQAQWEIELEQFEEAVRKEKERILSRKGFWRTVFPFKITIERV